MPGYKTHSRRAALALAFLLAIFAPAVARADSLTLAWDPNPEPDVVGYYVFIGTASGVYSTVVDVGSATNYTFSSALPGTTYYLTVAAYVAGPIIGPHAPEVVTTTGGGPTLGNPGNRTDTRGTPVSLTLSATDPNGDPITFGGYGLPTGLSVDPYTGIISGTPTTAGAFNVAVTASDPSANFTTQYFVWTIVATDTAPPVITILSPASGGTHATSSAFVTLTGTASDDVGVTSVAWANSRGGAGTAAGTSSWSVVVPLQSGSNVLTMTAHDATGKTTSAVLTVTVDLAPSVTITSPTAAGSFTSTSATLTLGGTSSDDVSVASVTWSNSRGGSGTAVGTTSWTVAGIALQTGTNVLTVTARDSAGRTSTATLTVSYAAPALQVTSLTANKTAPQTVGTSIAFTATASGGTAPYQYKWWLFDGATWSVLQNWSAAGTFNWTPTTASASYRLGVWVRSADRTADASDNDASNRSLDFPISAAINPLSLASLTSDKASPQFVSTAIRFTASARGGSGPYEFKWRLFDGTSWSVLQAWNTSATLTWTPGSAGSAYQVEVWARSAGQASDAPENANSSATRAFVINPTPTAELALTALTADKTAPQDPFTTITFTASASGGTGPYQYKWWLFNGTTWAVEQNWSSRNTFAWTPSRTGSAYRIGVWVRSATSSADASDNDASNRSMAFPIAPTSAALNVTGLTADKLAPQVQGTSIRFVASASGGAGSYGYKFRVHNGSTWTVVRDWSTSNSFLWTPATPSTSYRIEVWARSADNLTDAPENGATGSLVFPITAAPSASASLTLTAITADRTAPQVAGTPITFTAQAAGGAGPYAYKWWLFDGARWDLLRDWTSGATLTWTPPRPNSQYRVGVWVRSAGSSRDESDNAGSNGSVAFPVTSGTLPLSLANVSVDRSSPQAAGTPITFTAAATGGTAPYSFKWRVFNGSSWATAQNWSTSSSFVWAPSTAGSAYQVEVWVRSAGSTADAPDNPASSLTRSYTITYTPTAPLRLLSLTPDRTGVQVGASLTVTATATGGVPEYLYKWWLFDGSQWTMLTGWTTSPQVTWTPTRRGANYRIGVWVRSRTNQVDMSDNDASNGSIPVPVE